MGVGMWLAALWTAALFPEAGVETVLGPDLYFAVIGGALVFLTIAWQIPAVASSIMLGSVLFSPTLRDVVRLSASMAAAGARLAERWARLRVLLGKAWSVRLRGQRRDWMLQVRIEGRMLKNDNERSQPVMSRSSF